MKKSSSVISAVLIVFLFFSVLIAYYQNAQFERPRQKLITVSRIPFASEAFTVDNGNFQEIFDGLSAFVYSAYIDDRRAKDVKTIELPLVRIFAYFPYETEVVQTWSCVFWYSGPATRIAILRSVERVTDLDTFSRRRFKVAMILCQLPTMTNETLVLKGVSLASNFSVETINFLPLTDLRRRKKFLEDPTPPNFDEERNTDVASIQSLHYDLNYTVCAHSPIHGNYYNVTDIVNFIEVSRLFGAQKFIFYLSADTDPSLRYCLQSYEERGLVEIYPFTPPDLDGLHYHGQILSMNECVYRTMYRTKYLLLQDLDEVVVPLKADDWPNMLAGIHASHKLDPDKIASYSFANQFLPMGAPDDETFKDNDIVKRNSINALLKTTRNREIFDHGERSKVMVRPERILQVHVHEMIKNSLNRRGDRNYKVSKKDALLFHYHQIKIDQGAFRDARMQRNARTLIETVNLGMGHCKSFDDTGRATTV